MFVDFFFVLSGFVIAHTYGERLAQRSVNLRGFMLLRFGRIYPLHAFMLAVLIGMETFRFVVGLGGRELFDEGRSIPAIFTHLALLHSMGIHATTTWNGVSWSIAAEMWAYLLFAVIFRVFPQRATSIMLGAGVVCFAVLLAFSPRGLDATYDFGFARGIMGFAVGVGVYAVLLSGARPSGTVGELAVIAAAVAGAYFWHEGTPAFLMLPLFAVAVLVFSSERGIVSRALLLPLPRYLGQISYSIYMTHTLVLFVAFELIKRVGTRHGFAFVGEGHITAPPMTGELVTVTMLFGVVALATMTYRFVEVPARDWIRHAAARYRAAAPPAAAAAA
jgi:peptidoglycan/LPS O-acetylase OafA/YrhL